MTSLQNSILKSHDKMKVIMQCILPYKNIVIIIVIIIKQ